MIKDNVKIKNGLMEKLYECISEKLVDIETYDTARNMLTSFMQSFNTASPSFTTRINHTDKKSHFIIKMGSCEFDLIQLYRDEGNSYYLSLSPPNENDTIDAQIMLVNELLDHLK